MIEVRTCARLHLGLLDNNGEQGRLYGSIGLAINQPHLVLKADSADRLITEGQESDRVAEYARRFIGHYGAPSGARLNLETGIPSHVGLGSGTQIAMAVGTALAALAGLRLSPREIALAVGRGMRSGIGIATFQRGGFVLDGGHRLLSGLPAPAEIDGLAGRMEKNSIPPVLFRHPVPKSWYFVTVIPKADKGFSGEKENIAFRQLPPAPAQLVEKSSRLLLMKMLPALVEKDAVGFGQALTDIQRMIGDFFASVQDGRFSNSLSEEMIRFMLDWGALGAGQSSWGPAVYGLVDGKMQALRLVKEVNVLLDSLGGGEIFCVQPQNRGAQVRKHA